MYSLVAVSAILLVKHALDLSLPIASLVNLHCLYTTTLAYKNVLVIIMWVTNHHAIGIVLVQIKKIFTCKRLITIYI